MEEHLEADNSISNHMAIVGIGTSAGGLEALERFFRAISKPTGMAFVVIQHLSPDHKSMMAEILTRYTNLNICNVDSTQGGIEMKEDSVYLIPPKSNLVVREGNLYVEKRQASAGFDFPIDIFMHSLAEYAGKNAVGIVLSGAGSDGTLGLRSIKSGGGLTVVQDEETARFSSMPQNAIATHMIDVVAPPEDMWQILKNYGRYLQGSPLEIPDRLYQSEAEVMSAILLALKDRSNHNFTGYKPNTLYRRIEKRMGINQISKIRDYLDFVRSSQNECDTLSAELLIGVTQFFRDKKVWESLKASLKQRWFHLPKPPESTRVWCAGCSTGEEAYTIAMMLRELIDETKSYLDIKIFATDLNAKAIEVASTGQYPMSIAVNLNKSYLDRYFDNLGDCYKVKDVIRKMVIFCPHNVIKDPPFNNIDLVTCRNLMIYLNAKTQTDVLSNFHYSLHQQSGVLLLGSSEDVGSLSNSFESLDASAKLFRSVGSSRGQSKFVSDRFQVRDSERRVSSLASGRISHVTEIIGDLHTKLINKTLSPCLIVEHSGLLLHTSGNLNEYIDFPQGVVRMDVRKILKRDLASYVSSGLYKSEKNNLETIFKKVPYSLPGGHDRQLDIHIIPLQLNNTEKYFCVLFKGDKEVDHQNQPNQESVIIKERDRIRELEDELRISNENLQATIEELETSNEELQATNEELMASNEELQSTNEELQSVNEELYTVNSEHQAKIDILTNLNSDINNLLLHSELQVLYLDTELRIKYFTPSLSSIIDLMDADVGRSILHFSFKRHHQILIDSISKCVNEKKSAFLTLDDDKVNKVSIKPFFDETEFGGGLILSFRKD